MTAVQQYEERKIETVGEGGKEMGEKNMKSVCRTLPGTHASSERFQSYSQEVFMAISGAEGNNTNIIKKRKEGTAEIKAAWH